MQITEQDIKEVQAILRRWRTQAEGKLDSKKQVEKVMRILDALYTGGKG